MAFTDTREYGFEPQQETQMAAGASALRRKERSLPGHKVSVRGREGFCSGSYMRSAMQISSSANTQPGITSSNEY